MSQLYRESFEIKDKETMRICYASLDRFTELIAEK